jgi:hypothetical protein
VERIVNVNKTTHRCAALQTEFCFKLEVTEYTRALWSACVDPKPCDVHLPRFNTPVVYLLVNTNNLLHVNTTFTQYTINTIFSCNVNNTSTRASVQQEVEADWLTTPRDIRCAEASKIQPSSFVSRNLAAETRPLEVTCK